MAAGQKYLTYQEVNNFNFRNIGIQDLYFSQGIKYTILKTESGYYNLYCYEKDGTTNALYTVTPSEGDYHTEITGTLNNYVVQNKTTNNNWYPAGVCWQTYSALNNASKVLPIGYQQYVSINPVSGKLKAKDFIVISGSTEVSLLERLRPQPSTFTINTRDILTATLGTEGVISFTNLVMTLTTDYGSCTWNFGTRTGTGTDITVTNISASRSTLTCGKSYAPRLSFSGTVCGKALSNYVSIYVSEFSPNHYDTISPGDSYAQIGIGSTESVPADQSHVVIDFIEHI